MPFTPINVVNGSTPANAAWGNLVQTQYTEATQSFEQDLFSAFVLTGLVASKDGSIANQLDVTSGVAFLLQSSDSTLRRRAPTSSTQTTATANSTYYLDLNPDGSWSWGTAHSAVSNHLTICTVTTDGSGNISGVTDTRQTVATLLPGAASAPALPKLYTDAGKITSDGNGGLTARKLTASTWQQTGNYDQIQVIAVDATWMAVLGEGDAAYGGGAGTYLYDNKNSGFVFKNATKNGITFTGTVIANQFEYTGAVGTGTSTILNIAPTDAGQKNIILLYNGSSHSIQFYNLTDNKDLLDINPTGTVGLPNGGFSTVAGQATAGSFGVPVIVAQALDTHVTGTGSVNLISLPVSAPGLYRVSGSLTMGNTSAEAVSLLVSYNTGHGAGANGVAAMSVIQHSSAGSALVPLTGSEAALAAGAYPLSPLVVEIGSGFSLSVDYTDPGGSPSDYISIVVERLA